MASRRELETIIRLAGNLDPSLRRALLDAQRRMGDVGNTSSKMSNLISKSFKLATTAAVTGAAAIGAGLLYIAKQGLDLASDLTEVQNVVDVTFGESSTQIDAWAKSALSAYGLSELSAKQYSSTLGALMKSSGVSSKSLVTMSENLTALSGDFASFYNLDPAAAFEKIKSGISGETEPLKALGINMSVANLEAFALSKGIKAAFSDMSQADQVMLRYNYLLERSADAQGDFTRTQDNLANQQRLAKESFKQLSGTIMSAAIPAMTTIYKKANELISTFMNSPDKIQKLQNAISNVADKTVELIPIMIGYVKDFGDIIGVVYNKAVEIYQYISSNWSTLAPIIYGIVGAMAAWKLAMGTITAYNAVVKTGTLLINGLKVAYDLLRPSKIKDAAITLYLKGLYAKDTIVRAANTAATWAMVAAGTTWNIIAGIGAAVTTAFGAAIAFLTSPIGLVILAVAAIGAALYLLWKNWDQVWAWIVDMWQNYIQPVFQSIGEWFTAQWTSMVDGLKTAWSGVSSWFSGLWDGIKGTFNGFLNGAIDGINKLIGGINKIHFKLPKWAGGEEFGINIPTIPTFAKGGFTNQPSIFGEAGPEAAIPLKRTPRSLSLLNKTAAALGVSGGSGGSPQFIFSPVISGGDTAGVMTTLKSAADDFFEQADRWWESKRRESFG
ncbi:hypothetical protein ACFWMP_13910 [Paenibacillus sp. NPDC058367]|uniref:hypothetical protein n=1 Tax=Paenibacillus sp. NPDC058367 TaxID=3346460 RepID=UPI0036589ECB